MPKRVSLKGSSTRTPPAPAPRAPRHQPAATPQGIVAATGVAAKSNVKGLGEAMEAAMAKAVADAGKEGITDPGKIRERMMAAKDKARVEFEAAAARAARK